MWKRSVPLCLPQSAAGAGKPSGRSGIMNKASSSEVIISWLTGMEMDIYDRRLRKPVG